MWETNWTLFSILCTWAAKVLPEVLISAAIPRVTATLLATRVFDVDEIEYILVLG